VSKARPFTFLPSDGTAMTLDDLAEFLVEARANSLPGTSYVRTMGALGGFDMTNGPRCSRLTVIPGEVSRVD
jgi:hypothetical protein